MADGVRPLAPVDARPAPPDLPARERRFTVAELDRLAELGFFDHEAGRHELWDGRIMMAPPPGGPHTDVHSRANQALVAKLLEASLQEAFRVFPGGGLLLSEGDVCEPDLMVARLPFDRAARMPPAQVALIVEIAFASLADDLGPKRRAYAAAGIAEYWVVDIVGGKLHVFREPVRGHYASAAVLEPNAEVAPLFSPQISFSVADFI